MLFLEVEGFLGDERKWTSLCCGRLPPDRHVPQEAVHKYKRCSGRHRSGLHLQSHIRYVFHSLGPRVLRWRRQDWYASLFVFSYFVAYFIHFTWHQSVNVAYFKFCGFQGLSTWVLFLNNCILCLYRQLWWTFSSFSAFNIWHYGRFPILWHSLIRHLPTYASICITSVDYL